MNLAIFFKIFEINFFISSSFVTSVFINSNDVEIFDDCLNELDKSAFNSCVSFSDLYVITIVFGWQFKNDFIKFSPCSLVLFSYDNNFI